MPDERTELLLGLVPASIRSRAFRAAGKRGNLNDEIVGVLARHYNVPFTPTGRPAPPDAYKKGDRKMLLRLPDDLDRAILMDAVEKRTNKTEVACMVLAEHYGVKYRPRSVRRTPVGGGRQTVRA